MIAQASTFILASGSNSHLISAGWFSRITSELVVGYTTSSLPADQDDSTVDTSVQLDSSTEEESDQQDPACLEVIAEEPIGSSPIFSWTRSHTK